MKTVFLTIIFSVIASNAFGAQWDSKLQDIADRTRKLGGIVEKCELKFAANSPQLRNCYRKVADKMRPMVMDLADLQDQIEYATIHGHIGTNRGIETMNIVQGSRHELKQLIRFLKSY